MQIDDFMNMLKVNENNYFKRKKNEWEEIKTLCNLIKETTDYFKVFPNDLDHKLMIDNFNIVLDNMVSLANTLEFKEGIELAMLCGYLLHNGFLSESGTYHYQMGIIDIQPFSKKFRLDLALKIFSGEGCCRHSAKLLSFYLDRFNIEKSITSTYFNNTKDDNINEIRLFLSNYKKNNINANHCFNHINDSKKSINYFVDITSFPFMILYADKQFAYSFHNKDYKLPLFSYNYDVFNTEFRDYSKFVPLEMQDYIELYSFAYDALGKCLSKDNRDLFIDFYFQNQRYYHKINRSYNKIYLKEKRLTLI